MTKPRDRRVPTTRARARATDDVAPATGAASKFHTVFRRAFEGSIDAIANACARLARRRDDAADGGGASARAEDGDAMALCGTWRAFAKRYAAHTRAEDEVLFPFVASRIENVAYAYEFEHEAEEWLFEEVTGCLETLAAGDGESGAAAKAARIVHATRTTLKAHLAKESEHVLPMLEARFGADEQRELVWRFVGALSAEEACDMLAWAATCSDASVNDDLERAMAASAVDSEAAIALRRSLRGAHRKRAESTPILRALFVDGAGGGDDDDDDGELATTSNARRNDSEPARKRRRQAANGGAGTSTTTTQQKLPIDHIFQFHNALRHELRRLEHDILAISSTGTDEEDARLVRMIDGRFVFLRGVYEAHSMSEDDIVFPALEAKSALHNVSHSYTLDHKQEAELMKYVVELIAEMRSSVSTAGEGQGKEKGGNNKKAHSGFREGLVNDIQQACVAMRVSMETHVAKEEAELWPLFEKHFSFEEQEKIVGQIIGRTGAEVLRSMLIWVRNALNEDEREGMISSMRHATQNTRFAQWMNTWYSGKVEDLQTIGDDWVKSTAMDDDDASATTTKTNAADTAAVSSQDGMRQVHAYLSRRSGDVDKETFKPGWEDIFRMNQIQLEDAVRTVNRDDTLAPTKKAYLIQNLLASRWIVGNQLQAQKDKTTELSSVGSAQKSGAPAILCQPVDEDEENGKDGCKHYKRRCKIVAPCCDQAFTCRFCHDDASDHTVNRYAVKEMVCNECKKRQPVNEVCAGCSTSMAKYHCNVCNLFDDSSEAIYHCPFCNVCRRGKGLGVDFFHCMKCNACVSLQHGKHECSERGMDSECPVCKEFLAESETPVKELPCGHIMHATCFTTYTRHYYTCPLCRKSLGDFSMYFRMLDAILADESDDSVPEALRGKTQKVSCNDCAKDSDAKFHFVYHACAHCRSYNTRVLTFD
jgi:zinc finger-like protein